MKCNINYNFCKNKDLPANSSWVSPALQERVHHAGGRRVWQRVQEQELLSQLLDQRNRSTPSGKIHQGTCSFQKFRGVIFWSDLHSLQVLLSAPQRKIKLSKIFIKFVLHALLFFVQLIYSNQGLSILNYDCKKKYWSFCEDSNF